MKYENSRVCPHCEQNFCTLFVHDCEPGRIAKYGAREQDKCGTCGESHTAMDACRGFKYANPVLNERESTHGDYANTARIAQKLKALLAAECDMSTSPEWKIQDIQSESLDMICTKIARIISGNGNDPDHWKDIAGYANLVSERLK
jgi:hypothetical protein